MIALESKIATTIMPTQSMARIRGNHEAHILLVSSG
jgi:hypothetical protein